MTATFKRLAAATALTLAAAAPAAADYTILEDTSLPSVVFVEFSGTEPVVIKAPSSKDIVDETAALGDPALPPAEEMEPAETMEPVEPLKSVEDRIEDRIKELEGAADAELEMPAPELMEGAVDTPSQDAVVEEASMDDVMIQQESQPDILGEAELR